MTVSRTQRADEAKDILKRHHGDTDEAAIGFTYPAQEMISGCARRTSLALIATLRLILNECENPAGQPTAKLFDQQGVKTWHARHSKKPSL